MRSCAVLFVLVPLVFGTLAGAEEWSPEPLRYSRIVLDESDRSYFADVSESFEMRDFAPPAGPVGVAPWVGDWHPTPRVQYVMVLRGAIEVTVEDGEVRRFDPGSVLLLEDVRGKGHDTKVVSDEPALFAIVAVPPTPAE